MSIHVRAATLDDLPAILDIYNHAVLHSTATADREPHTLSQRQAWFGERTGAGFPIFVAVDVPNAILNAERADTGAEQADAGVVVGWSAYGPYHNRVGYRFSTENSVYVHHAWRGQGVGKRLLAPLLDHARARGMHTMIASIDSENEASVRLHARFGFVQSGYFRQTVRKFDRWLDVVYMQKMLRDASE